MRFDIPVYFLKYPPAEYDAKTGNHTEQPPIEEKRRASVTESGTDTLQMVYGSVKQNSLTIRLKRPYNELFDRIRVYDTEYRVDWSRKFRSGKQVFVVSEVQ